MSDEKPSGASDHSQPEGQGGAFSQQFQHTSVGARLPERVAQGVFSTGVIVMEGSDEFVVNFFQGLNRPPRVATRVVMSPNVMGQFINALRENLQRFEQAFGPPKSLPTQPSGEHHPSVQDIYQDLRLPDDMLSGCYANTVMIGHSPSEFFFDFITRFYPTAAVSARVYLSASQVPQMLSALNTAMKNRSNREAEAKKNPPPNAG